MTTQELEEEAKTDKIEKFFKEQLGIVERFMKIQCKEEGNMVSALLMDQIFKSIVIKLDQVFTQRDKQMKEYLDKCTNKVEQIEIKFSDRE